MPAVRSGLLLAVLADQHLLALLRGELVLEDRELVLAGVRDLERGRLAIEPVCRERVARRSDALELAPGEHLDRARVAGLRGAREQVDVLGARLAGAHMRDRIADP